MENNNIVQDVIDSLGGARRLADTCGVSVQAVYGWLKPGNAKGGPRIPQHHFDAVLLALRDAGSPISLEALAGVYCAGREEQNGNS